jgi:hypothetical protein
MYLDLKTEGIFRLSGSANVINEYKRKFDAGEPVDFMKESDCHAVTGIIKLYLRELPEPLLTFDLHPYFMAMDGCKEKAMRLRFTRYLISRLPPLNRATLKRLMGFLVKVSKHADVNKMALHNLATVFGPNLLGTRDKNIMAMVESTAQVNNVTNYLIQEYHAIFEVLFSLLSSPFSLLFLSFLSPFSLLSLTFISLSSLSSLSLSLSPPLPLTRSSHSLIIVSFPFFPSLES